MQTFTVPALLRTPGARVTAVTSRTPASRESFARLFGIAHCHASLASLLSDPDVDAVYAATPPGSHASLAADCLRARKPCVLEKVCARSAGECRAIHEAFQTASLPLIVNQHKRFLPKFIAIKQLLRTQQLGTIHSVHYNFASPLAQQLHDAHADEHHAQTTSGGSASSSASSIAAAATGGSAAPAATSPCSNWRQDCEQSGGGLVMEFGAELFDVLDFLFGPVTHVQGDAIHVPLHSSSATAATTSNASDAALLENVVTATFRLCDPSAAAVAAASTGGASSESPTTASLAYQRVPVLCTASFSFVVSQAVDQLVIQGSKAQLCVSLFGTDPPVLRGAAVPVAAASSSLDGALVAPTAAASVAVVRLPPVENPHAAWLAQVVSELRVWRSGPADPHSLTSTSSAAAMRTAQVLDAMLRGYYRDRNDAFWKRPHTWRHDMPPSAATASPPAQ
jgi:predicted dehydrogenase